MASGLQVITFRPEPTNHTSIAKMPKRYLAPALAGGVMGDAHARLRDLAREYRR
jgi:hypothetical protein